MNKKETTKLWSKDFSLLIIGQIISLFGHGILTFALPLYILETSGSPAFFGIASALALLPMIIVSPIGGIMADRVKKQRIMVVLDFTTAGIILLYLAVSGFVDVVPVIVAVLMALFAIQGIYAPTVQSSVPVLVAEKDLIRAGSIVNMIESLSGMIGPAVGGLLYGFFGLTPILVVGAIGFALSAVIELFLRIPHQKQEFMGSIFQLVKGDMAQSIHFMTREKPILAKTGLTVVLFSVVLVAMIQIALPVLVTQTLGMENHLFGITKGAFAAGGLAGGILTGILGDKLRIKNVYKVLFLCSVATIPTGLVFLLEVPTFAAYIVITVSAFLMMATATMSSIQLITFVQGNTPMALIGKVMSYLMLLSICSQAIGQLLFGVLFEQFSSLVWMPVIGAALVGGMIALYSRNLFREMAST